MHQHNTSSGIDEESLRLNAERYDTEQLMEGPLSEGVLIWDEVKV